MNRRSLLKLFSSIPAIYVSLKYSPPYWDDEGVLVKSFLDLEEPVAANTPPLWRLYINGAEAGRLLSVSESTDSASEIGYDHDGVWHREPSAFKDIELEYVPSAVIAQSVVDRADVVVTDGEVRFQFNALILEETTILGPDQPVVRMKLYANG